MFSFLDAKAPLPPRATWSRLQIPFFSFFWIATPQFDQNAGGPIATVAGRFQNTWNTIFEFRKQRQNRHIWVKTLNRGTTIPKINEK